MLPCGIWVVIQDHMQGLAGLTCDAFQMSEDVHFALISDDARGVPPSLLKGTFPAHLLVMSLMTIFKQV